MLPNIRANAGSVGMSEPVGRRSGRRVVFLENQTSSLFLEELHEIETYEVLIRRLAEACVELSVVPAEVGVREKHPAGPALPFSRNAFSAFLGELKGQSPVRRR